MKSDESVLGGSLNGGQSRHSQPKVVYRPAFAPVPYHMGLYPVVDSVVWIERLLDLGVKTIQLRLKAGEWHTLSDDQAVAVEAAVKQAIALGRQYDARLFINDYWQLAIRHKAYGVHLGQEDLSHADLDAIAKAGLRLGVSTHNKQEIKAALFIRPSYIGLGHIFATQTKQMPSSPQGLTALAQQVAWLGDYPTVAIGGISIEKVPEVLATGVPSIALVSAITKASDWQDATCQLLKIMEQRNDVKLNNTKSKTVPINDNAMITVVVNDKHLTYPIGISVADIVVQTSKTDSVAVALNEQILPKNDWDTLIQAGDSLLIFEAIAGG